MSAFFSLRLTEVSKRRPCVSNSSEEWDKIGLAGFYRIMQLLTEFEPLLCDPFVLKKSFTVHCFCIPGCRRFKA